MKDQLINLVADALLKNQEMNKKIFLSIILTFWMSSRGEESNVLPVPHEKSRCLFILEANLHLGFITSLSVANIKCIAGCKNPPPDIIVHHSQERSKMHFINLRPSSISESSQVFVQSWNEVQYRSVSRLTLIS